MALVRGDEVIGETMVLGVNGSEIIEVELGDIYSGLIRFQMGEGR